MIGYLKKTLGEERLKRLIWVAVIVLLGYFVLQGEHWFESY